MTENSLGYNQRLLEFADILLNFTLESNENSPFSSSPYQYTIDSSNSQNSDKEETKTEQLPGYLAIKKWSELLPRISNAIYAAIDLTYNYYPMGTKIPDGAFNMLVSACDNSNIFEYDSGSDELFERKELSQLASSLFELQIELNQPRWINKLQPNINNVVNLIKDYNRFFESHKTELKDEEVKFSGSIFQESKDCPAGYKFWLKTREDKDTGKVYSVESFNAELDRHLSVFNTMLEDFTNLKTIIQNFITSYLDACNEIGFMGMLISIVDKDTDIAGVLNTIRGVGFGPYSPKLKAFYDKFQLCVSIWKKSNYSVVDRNHIYLRRIINSEVYKNIDFYTAESNRNFFSQIKNWLLWVNRFRERWSL